MSPIGVLHLRVKILLIYVEELILLFLSSCQDIFLFYIYIYFGKGFILVVLGNIMLLATKGHLSLLYMFSIFSFSLLFLLSFCYARHFIYSCIYH